MRRKKTIILIITIIICFIMTNAYSQFTPTVENIPIPSTDGGGSMIGDIVKSENHVFVYSLDKVVAYNNNGSYAGEVNFNLSQDYGKFHPFYFWEPYYTASTSLMVYNNDPNAPYLYVVAPNLDIYFINLDPASFLSYDYDTPEPMGSNPSLDSFKPLHGNCILKYDDDNERLFWVIDGRHPTANGTGSFHVRQRYLFIFETNNSTAELTTLYSGHEYSSTTNYQNAGILDLEINKNSNSSQSDYFYLSKINRLEVWGIDKSNPYNVSMVLPYNIPDNYNCSSLYKTSLKYIYDESNDVHNIIAYPYRFPSCGNMSDPDIFVLDGDHTSSNISWINTASPSLEITDAEYLSENQHLVLSHASDPLNTPIGFDPDDDISIYQLSPSSNIITFIESIDTDNSPLLPCDPDFNTPIKLLPISSSELLVCKEDEICHLSKPHTVYQCDSKLISENNFFMKGVSFYGGNKFLLNTTSNGINLLNSDLNSSNINIRNGYQANHICMDNNGDKFYIFNKLNTYETGCYIYDGTDVVNINTPLGSPITAPIGDCIYNPYLDHFLISENAYFDNRAAGVKIFNNDNNNSYLNTLTLEKLNDGQKSYYARNMFISPEGLLYVMADMNYNQGSHPVIFIFSADNSNYQQLGAIDVTAIATPGINHDFFDAHFCFNHHNGKVYVTINPLDDVITPYNSSSNSIYNHSSSTSGLLIEIDGTQLTGSVIINTAGKIICPYSDDHNSQSRYGENMYIIGTFLHEVKPPYCDLNSINTIPGGSFNDITYNSFYDIMIAIKDDELNISVPRHRITEVYTIDYDSNDDLEFTLIHTEDGQSGSIFNNPYDQKIYILHKTDENKLGDTPVRLLCIDPQNLSAQPTTIDLELNSLYPEVDHNSDFGFFLYNISTSAINPYNNTMYIPNGGHSCVSKVTFEAKEPLYLEEGGWTWLSFPRMNRDNNDAVLIPTVLNANIEPETYETGSKLENIEIGSIVSKYCFYDSDQGWIPEEIGLQHIQSTLGYKLQLNYGTPPEQSILFMQGNLYDHFAAGCNNCLLNLTGASNNTYWVGYYYPVSQNIIDAIPDELEPYISVIKGQYYSCYAATHSDGSIQWTCAINKRPPVIGYGDMVEIVLLPGESISNYYWSIYNNIPDEQERPGTEYFTFTETADYTPVFIELDTNQNPMEIGAFVNDSCIGASTVLPDDSVILVPAYVDSLSGEIYFEQYYGSLKSAPPPVATYYVENQQTKIREQRLIHTSECKPYYIVSFKNKQEEAGSTANKAWVSCSPNPIKDHAHLSFYIPEDSYIEIRLYNLMGMLQNKLFSGHTSAGTHNIDFELEDSNGRKLCNGSYVISMTSAKYQAQTKIVVIN